MSKINSKALAILTRDEKTSMALQHGHNKSSWEAGEMMNRSHYKYLEIKYRAEMYLKVFSNHFNLYHELVPDFINVSPEFREYITLCICKRMKIKDAVNKINNPLINSSKEREAHLTKDILKLRESSDPHYQNLYTVIMDFDRYNNFRILPREVQEPSAFKRRNSTRYKKHLKISTSIPLYSLKRIKEIFESKVKKLANEGWVVLLNREFEQNCGIVRINANTDNLKIFTKLSLYVFDNFKDADEFAQVVLAYISQKTKDPKEGLKFWPSFRNLIKRAINHDKINNISATRKSLISAMKDMDITYKGKK